MFLNNDDILSRFIGRNIFIYGAGEDAKTFYRYFNERIDISGFIVSASNETDIFGLTIYGKEKCLDDDVKGKIIIATSKYENEIAKELDILGLKCGKDFFIWNKKQLGIYDSACVRLIHWNKKTWNNIQYGVLEEKVLIPIENVYDSNIIYHAYLTDYLKREYKANIECYIRNNNQNIDDSIKEIYKSFGVETIVYPKLEKKQEEKAKRIFNEIWDSIVDFEDWAKITIYGICFGTTIIRSYLRFKDIGIEPRSESFKEHLYECIRTIVFWYDRITNFKYKMVVMWDGTHWEGFIRDIAITEGIPIYATTYDYFSKLELDFAPGGKQYKYYRNFWNMLSSEEKKEGVEKAKKILTKRISGKAKDDCKVIPGKDPYAVGKKERVLSNSNKIKIMIAMHIFDEDCYAYGRQIFDNNYVAWLVHLGELSKKYTQYDWYIKKHPHGGKRDEEFLSEYLKKYSNIKLIEKMISPIQLKEEGLDFVLTVHGTVGSEYPIFGIQVINAGANPHEAFDFDWNPKNKEEYDKLLSNLENIDNLCNANEVYQFFAINNSFYNHNIRNGYNFFSGFRNSEIGTADYMFINKGIDKRAGTWKFDAFLDEINEEKHKMLIERLPKAFKQMDEWKPNIFYKL